MFIYLSVENSSTFFQTFVGGDGQVLEARRNKLNVIQQGRKGARKKLKETKKKADSGGSPMNHQMVSHRQSNAFLADLSPVGLPTREPLHVFIFSRQLAR